MWPNIGQKWQTIRQINKKTTYFFKFEPRVKTNEQSAFSHKTASRPPSNTPKKRNKKISNKKIRP